MIWVILTLPLMALFTGCHPEPLCDDGDLCTIDLIEGSDCVYELINCDDGDSTTNDFCINGACQNTPITYWNCTTDADCDDGDLCTDNDHCEEGMCVYSLINCEDGDPCTTDFCINGGCSNTPINCDDGDSLTVIDMCVNGNCVYL